MKQCAKTSGTCLIQTIRNLLNITTWYWKSYLFLRIFFENKKKWFYLSRQFNQYCYNSIEEFQSEKAINVPLHTRDVNAKKYIIYRPFAKETQYEDDNLQSQNNVLGSQNKVASIHGVKIASFVDLFEEIMEFLPNSN